MIGAPGFYGERGTVCDLRLDSTFAVQRMSCDNPLPGLGAPLDRFGHAVGAANVVSNDSFGSQERYHARTAEVLVGVPGRTEPFIMASPDLGAVQWLHVDESGILSEGQLLLPPEHEPADPTLFVDRSDAGLGEVLATSWVQETFWSDVAFAGSSPGGAEHGVVLTKAAPLNSCEDAHRTWEVQHATGAYKRVRIVSPWQFPGGAANTRLVFEQAFQIALHENGNPLDPVCDFTGNPTPGAPLILPPGSYLELNGAWACSAGSPQVFPGTLADPLFASVALANGATEILPGEVLEVTVSTSPPQLRFDISTFDFATMGMDPTCADTMPFHPMRNPLAVCE